MQHVGHVGVCECVYINAGTDWMEVLAECASSIFSLVPCVSNIRPTTTRHATSTIAGHCTRAMPSKRPDEFFITLLRSAYSHSSHGATKRRPTVAAKLPTARALSVLAVHRTRPIGPRRVQCLSRPLSIRGTRGYATAQPPAKSTSKTAKNPKKPTAPEPRKIAILGGGITGLTAAHYLARHATNAHITIYEGSNRLGGWIDGQHKEIGQGKEDDILLQSGPRMLRTGATSNKYDDLVLYDVVSTYPPTAYSHSPHDLSC